MGCIVSPKQYALEKLGSQDPSLLMCYPKVDVLGIEGRLQEELGEKRDGDCFLSSMVTIMSNLTNLEDKEIYDIIKENNRYGIMYNQIIGSNPLTFNIWIKSILQDLGINARPVTLYLKGLGFNFRDIQNILQHEKAPIILSTNSANENYYKYHAVVIVGIETYWLTSNRQKEVRLLKIYDNWTRQIRYIDYDTLHFASVITYLDNR